MDDALRSTLSAVARVMDQAREPWWIIAGAAVALHGVTTLPVADVDVLLGIDDARHLLPTLAIDPAPGAVHADFRSRLFGTWRETPLPVEFMAGFFHRQPSGWQAVAPRTRQAMVVDGSIVYVPDRHELRQLVASFRRPKDLERARLLG